MVLIDGSAIRVFPTCGTETMVLLILYSMILAAVGWLSNSIIDSSCNELNKIDTSI